ncbi:hypothetical protein ANTQUA_LOCUS3993 [Anthophora quadrimaculata]
MNFTLIPFFLAASVVVDQPDQWIYGPEYVFHASLKQSTSVYWRNHTATMRCRPAEMNSLLCRFELVTLRAYDKNPSLEFMTIDQPFLIQFSPRGVETLRLPEMIDDRKLYFIRSIAKSFSVCTDSRESMNTLPEYAPNRNDITSGCTTRITILENDEISSKPRNYELQILSLPNRREPNTTIMIEKNTEHSKRRYNIEQVTITTDESVNKMYINDKTFRSEAEAQMELKIFTKKHQILVEDVSFMELVNIERATEPMPPLNFDHVATLHYDGNLSIV